MQAAMAARAAPLAPRMVNQAGTATGGGGGGGGVGFIIVYQATPTIAPGATISPAYGPVTRSGTGPFAPADAAEHRPTDGFAHPTRISLT